MRSIMLSGCAFLLAACAVPASQRTDETNTSAGDAGFAMLESAPVESSAPPLQLAEVASSQAPERANDRQVVYSAALRLVVVSAREAFASIQALAKEAGGHLQESDARAITIRVPANTFEDVVAKISRLGEVVENVVRAADVTEEMLDLGIRLENARKARERLLAHLAKSEKVEDTLKIELELTRVTGEIERIEGRLRYMQSQIAMSTIRVELNTVTPQRGTNDGLDLPFEWIGRLGDGLVAGTVHGMPRKPSFLSRGPKFDPPAEFVRYYSSGNLVEAMNADGLRLKVREHDNFDEGALAFWSQLAKRSLVDTRALAVTSEQDLGQDRMSLIGTREVGNQTYGYLLLLVRKEKHLYTFEAWGPQESFDRQLAALVKSAKSLEQ